MQTVPNFTGDKFHKLYLLTSVDTIDDFLTQGLWFRRIGCLSLRTIYDAGDFFDTDSIISIMIVRYRECEDIMELSP